MSSRKCLQLIVSAVEFLDCSAKRISRSIFATSIITTSHILPMARSMIGISQNPPGSVIASTGTGEQCASLAPPFFNFLHKGCASEY
jgi:hypothetical protein